jgi:hypothetical protein
VNCGQCGRSNRPGALFCGGCGTGLTRRCAKCDAELDSDLAFCDLRAKSYSSGNVVLSAWPSDSSYCVIVLDDEGQATSCEFFDEHQWNDAFMRFDELSEA